VYPSIAGETNRGLGDAGLRFYPPLTYYALAVSYMVIRDWYFASLLVFTLVFFIGGVGIYLWTSEEFESRQALTAAILYTFAPYHLNQLYNNALFAEFCAMAVVPYCFLFLTRVCRKNNLLNMFGLTIAYALLILTHLPLTILCSIAMAAYAILLLRKTDLAATVFKLLAAVVSAAAMTSFYWLRFLPELSWIVHSSPKYFSTTWDYRSNFLLLPDHFLNYGEDALNLWLADVFLVAMLLIAVPTCVCVLRNKAYRSKYIVALLSVLTLAVFMTTPLSAFIWNNIAFLQKVQFPWRWLAVVTAFGSVFASIGIIRATDAMKVSKSTLLSIGLGSIFVVYVFTAAFLIKGAVYTPHADLNRMMQTIPESQGCECWWPVWAKSMAFGQTDKVIATGRKVDVIAWSAANKQFHIDAGDPATATIRSFYYPHWQAEINGSTALVEPSEDGLISLSVPGIESNIRLTFREPGYVKAANITSTAAWIILLVFAATVLLKSHKETPPVDV
jgi:hypothetical protein